MTHTIMLAATSQVAAAPSVFDLAVKGGVMMVPIALCSVAVLAVVAERLSVLRPSRVVPPTFRKRFEKAAEAGSDGLDAVRKLAKKPASPAARLVAAGVAKLGHTPDLVEKHLAAAGEEEVYRLRKRLRVLTVVAAVAPLLGLTGTIFGMIRSFQTVAASGENLGKAELLAGGIYEAMVTTAAGLLVAMPTVVFAHWFAGKVERLARDLDGIAVNFMESFVIEAAPVHSGRPRHQDFAEPKDNGVSLEPAPAVAVATGDEGARA